MKVTDDVDVARFAKAVAQALQQARSVSDSEHWDHHQWIVAQIRHEQEMAKFWHEMRAHVSKWGAISLISFVGYALYLGVKAALKLAV